MSEDQLQERLNNGIYGTPKLKAAEQAKYLGTFRERVEATLTFAELNEDRFLKALKEELVAHPEYRLTVSGDVPTLSLQKLLILAKEAKVECRLTDSQGQTYQPDDLAVVFASKDLALHREIIDIAALYPEIKAQVIEQAPKKSFWDKLFGNE